MVDESKYPTRIAPYGLRMPPALKDRVEASAKANNRSMNAEIVATLEEKYPVPERWFDYRKWRAHQERAERRSGEIIARMREINASYAGAKTRAEMDALTAEFDSLGAEHEALMAYSHEDDRFFSGDEDLRDAPTEPVGPPPRVAPGK